MGLAELDMTEQLTAYTHTHTHTHTHIHTPQPQNLRDSFKERVWEEGLRVPPFLFRVGNT